MIEQFMVGAIVGSVGIGFLWAVGSYLHEWIQTSRYAKRNGYDWWTAHRILEARRSK